jgi:molecular chaperone GrpE (heat shock protein)
MNLKIFNFFKKNKPLTGLQEQTFQILEEVKDLRKRLRKQNILLGSIKEDIIKTIVDNRRSGLEPYCEVADALFYYEAALQTSDQVSPEQQEALEIIWDKLDNLMSLVGLQIMRHAGLDFDPKIYEAIDNRAAGAAELVVLQVLQPGYIVNNIVLKPAKVVVDKKNHYSEG